MLENMSYGKEGEFLNRIRDESSFVLRIGNRLTRKSSPDGEMHTHHSFNVHLEIIIGCLRRVSLDKCHLSNEIRVL